MEYDAGIDKDNLDEESVYVPAMFDVMAIKEAEAVQKLNALLDKMKILQADIDLDIRGWEIEKINAYFKKDIGKVTETVYRDLLLIHPEVMDLYQEIEQARYESKIYEAARKSIEKKADSLDRLSRLHGQGYFMKIEGREYKKMGVNSVLERVTRVLMRRGAIDKAPPKAPPEASSKTRKKLKPLPKKTPKRVE